MHSSLDAIKRVIDAFERSDWSEIDVRTGDVRIHLAARPGSPSAATMPGPNLEPIVDEPPPADPAPEPSTGPDRSTIPDGAHIIEAPSPDIFWRSPEPGAPPFADVGDIVEPASTVCIIEVMKLMSHLQAGVAGEVVAVYGQNGVAVGTGEQLFAIAPVGSTS